MTDEAKALVEKLRDLQEPLHEWDYSAAADLIEELDRHLTLSGKVGKALSERIETLETQLESANEALRERLDICETQAREIERLREVLGFAIRTLEAEGFSNDGPTLTRIRAALAGDSHD